MPSAAFVFALLVVVFVSQSARLGRAYLNGPITFLLAGGVLGRALVDTEIGSEGIRTLAEVTLVLVLFHDAAELQPRQLRAESAFTARLLLIGLPLTIGAGFLLARGLFPEIGGWLALLVAAALAPTDAGLGAATVMNPVVPARVRRILNVESGLNDGLVTPAVLFAVAAAAGLLNDEAGHGVLEALREIAIGAVIGVLVGYLAGRLLDRSRALGWADRGLLPIAMLAVPLMCFYGAVALGANGFIAAFVAGIAAAASQTKEDDVHESMALTGLTSTFLSYAVWLVFGITAGAYLSVLLSWQNILFAVLSLTVLRVVPVAVALLGSGFTLRTVAFIGWFGPRGLASIIFALIAFESLHQDPAVASVLSVIATTVVLSVVAHGLTAPPWASGYGAWVSRTRPPTETVASRHPQPRHGFIDAHPSDVDEKEP